MIRNLKVLGLALVAMLALGVVAASASAAEFHAEQENIILTGAQTTTNTFTTDSGTIHCTTAKFNGTQGAKTTSSVTVTPTYEGCRSTGFIEANVTVDTNSCQYTIKANGEVVLGGGSCGNMVVTAPFCTITVAPQTLKSVSFSTVGAGTTREVETTANVGNIAYHEQGFACAHSGANTTGGTYEGAVKVTGSKAGSHVGVWYE